MGEGVGKRIIERRKWRGWEGEGGVRGEEGGRGEGGEVRGRKKGGGGESVRTGVRRRSGRETRRGKVVVLRNLGGVVE